MIRLTEQKNKIAVEFDITDLNPAQIRLLKSINTMLAQVTTTNDESEFFDGAAETVRMVAALIKQSHFVLENKHTKIPYSEQVIEYAIDTLQDSMSQATIIKYDN